MDLENIEKKCDESVNVNKNNMKTKSIMNAVYIGVLCSISYLAVYFARNILGTVTPQMIEEGYTEGYIGAVSSVYFILYAVGQLINGVIGDKIKAKYMISIGLLMAGIMNMIFSNLSLQYPDIAVVSYGLTGFFLSMIYGPITKVVAENTDPIYTTRCTLGYTFASFVASPLAGMAAAVMAWQGVFIAGSIVLVLMAGICFLCFLIFEKNGIIKYNKYSYKDRQSGGIKILIKHNIIKYTAIAAITGIIRTTVIFWMPTYTTQYLGFTPSKSAVIFTVGTFIISFTAYITVFIYEKINRNMDLTILLMFVLASLCFVLMYLIKQPTINIAFMIIGIMASNGAATMVFSRYCPGLRDTGMVSSVAGFLDFVSYIAAAVSSTIFANASTEIGWGNLILMWCGFMILGVMISLPYKKIKNNQEEI